MQKKRAPRLDKRPKTSLQLPPALKTRFHISVLKEGKTMRAVIIELVEAYLAKKHHPV